MAEEGQEAMKQCYREQTFYAKTREILDKIQIVADEYMQRGIILTVRQLFYQMVSRGYIENTQRNYGKVQEAANNGRMAGLIDWDAIEDRTRFERRNAHWSSPDEILQSAAESYHIDKRLTQPVYMECWVEKDALISLVESVARKNDVLSLSCRGFTSSSLLHDAAGRFIEQRDREECIILYAGDHDPSGLEISANIQKRLYEFGANVKVKRIALTMEQVEQYAPPPNTTKESDSRAKAYIRQYSGFSWELDALDPQVLMDLYSSEISALTDWKRYDELLRKEQADRRRLYEMIA